MDDPYSTLGVARDADEDAIRTRYRELARRYHPDMNPGNAPAEERFKGISEAYAVLSDPEKKAAFDEFGDAALQGGFDLEAARRARDAFGAGGRGFGGFGAGGGFEGFGSAGGRGGIEDVLSGLFGSAARGSRQPRPRAGPDLEADLELDFVDAARGCEQRLTINRPQPDGSSGTETVSVRIPPGVSDGGRVRLRGKGGKGAAGGPSGNLYARIRVRPHPVFRREGNDLYVDVPLSVREAVLGAKVEVPTLDGPVTLTIPAGTDSSTRLRLRGKGVPAAKQGGKAGDLFAVAQIRVPDRVSPTTAAALENLKELELENLRDDLLSCSPSPVGSADERK